MSGCEVVALWLSVAMFGCGICGGVMVGVSYDRARGGPVSASLVLFAGFAVALLGTVGVLSVALS